MMTTRRRLMWATLGFFLGASLAYHAYQLDADPVKVDFFSNGDEGNYSFNTRHHRLEGTYLSTTFNPMALGPLFTVVQSWTASLHPSPVARYRLISVLAVTMLIVVLAIAFRREMDGALLLLWIADLGLNFMLAVYSRLGIPEPLMASLFAITILAQAKTLRSGRPSWAFATGIVAALVIETKISGFIVVPILLVAYAAVALQARDPSDRLMTLKLGGWSAFGLVCGLGPWALFFVLPHYALWHDTVEFFVGSGAMQDTPTLSRWPVRAAAFFFSFTWESMPIVFVLALLWTIKFIPRAIRRQSSSEDWVYFCAWVGSALYLSYFAYQPLRWQLLVLPPMVLVAALELRLITRWRVSVGLLITAIAYTLIANGLHGAPLMTRHLAGPLVGMASLPLVVFLSVAMALSMAFFYRSARAPAITLLCLDLLLQGYFNRAILGRYQFTLRDTAASLAPLIGNGSLSGDGEVNIGLGLDGATIIPRYMLTGHETDQAFKTLFSKSGIPDYYQIVGQKIGQFKQEAPILFSCLTPLRELHFDLGSPRSPAMILFKVDSAKYKKLSG